MVDSFEATYGVNNVVCDMQLGRPVCLEHFRNKRLVLFLEARAVLARSLPTLVGWRASFTFRLAVRSLRSLTRSLACSLLHLLIRSFGSFGSFGYFGSFGLFARSLGRQFPCLLARSVAFTKFGHASLLGEPLFAPHKRGFLCPISGTLSAQLADSMRSSSPSSFLWPT